MESPAEELPSSYEAHLASLQSPGRSHFPSATKVTPNDDADYDPLPLDHCSSIDNLTLDLDNPWLFLANNDFDNVVDVKKNDIGKSSKGVGLKLIKSKNTTEKFYDAVENKTNDDEKSTTFFIMFNIFVRGILKTHHSIIARVKFK